MEFKNTTVDIKSKLKIKISKKLTTRQIEYLFLSTEGLYNSEIAKILCVQNSTVKKTFEVIFSKLAARTKVQAVNIAWMHQIFTSDKVITLKEKFKLQIENVKQSEY